MENPLLKFRYPVISKILSSPRHRVSNVINHHLTGFSTLRERQTFQYENHSRVDDKPGTYLSTRAGSSLDSRSFTNVLVVTTSVGMFNGVHSHTTNLGPAVTLRLVLVISSACLQHGLVDTTTTGNDACNTNSL